MKNGGQGEKNDSSAPEHQAPIGGIVLFKRYLASVGVTACCGWRWRRDGLISTINISGRVYVSRNEIARFEQRATQGEFRAIHVVPPPPTGQAEPEPAKNGNH
jgi:hypothetical protein